MHIVLHQPEIPGNTGNIGRTCVAAGAPLHLIEPLGFCLDEKSIKRAGLDYWDKLKVHRYMNFEEFSARNPGIKLWMATTKAKRNYTEVSFGPDDYIMFGKESAGIPEEILVEQEENCIRIPMLPDIRSLNLSNSVAIVLYEALRQNGFQDMQRQGELHRLHWEGGAEPGPEAASGAVLRQERAPEEQNCALQAASCRSSAGKEQTAYVAPGAVGSGKVFLEAGASVWYHAVVRGDREKVRIGRGSNVQDNCVVHVEAGFPADIGENVTVGHGAIVHGCTVGDNTLIGMGSILMNGCRVGRNCIVGAGALVTEGTVVPDNSLVLGSPGRVVRQVKGSEIGASLKNARLYAQEAQSCLEVYCG